MKEINVKKELKEFAKNLYSVLNPDIIDSIGKKHSFSQRKSKLQTPDFIYLCSLLSSETAHVSLTELCSVLNAHTGISISCEGLNQRFNSNAVNVLREIMNKILNIQINNQFLSETEKDFFPRIRILDATSFQLDNSFADIYKGSGGSSNTSGIKIQLEYDLITGQFLNVYSGSGSENDKTYGTFCISDVKEKDLCIRDLGYFDMKDFRQIHNKKAFYVSRIKLNSSVYIKSPFPNEFFNGKKKKYSEYKKIDLESIMNELEPGETVEIESVYCGRTEKLPTRLICYKLTQTQLKNRRKKQALLENKKGIKLSQKSRRLSGLNIYITNIPPEIVSFKQVHNLYSLRWQVEILFKTWKSIFKIHHCKKIKRERFECHLYGCLIGILISTSVMFKMRNLLNEKHRFELSEYKGINMIKIYLRVLLEGIKKGASKISKVLTHLFSLLKKNGHKSHKTGYRTSGDILKTLRLNKV